MFFLGVTKKSPSNRANLKVMKYKKKTSFPTNPTGDTYYLNGILLKLVKTTRYSPD